MCPSWSEETYKFVHHASKKFQVCNVFLIDAHLRQLARYQVKLCHLVVVPLHDVLQLLQLLGA